ncbi:hypothetical protein LguiA_030578 [Lonicera macranthoides]
MIVALIVMENNLALKTLMFLLRSKDYMKSFKEKASNEDQSEETNQSIRRLVINIFTLKKLYEKLIQEKRCLIVLDDIWSKDAWDCLKNAFPRENTKSKLLLTSCNAEVVIHVDAEGYLHQPRVLNEAESWMLLKNKAFSKRGHSAATKSKRMPLELHHSLVDSATYLHNYHSRTIPESPVDDHHQSCQTIRVDLLTRAKQPELASSEPNLLCRTTRVDLLNLDHEEVKEQEKLGIEMVKQCGGLPLAIVALGGILVTKHSLQEWENVRHNIKSFLRHGEGMGQHYGGVIEILALSYNDLPYQLKPCFLYLGKFPEDSEIEVERLYQLWMAESMVLSKDRKEGETMMDVAECYLGELANRCMVQVQLEEKGYGVTKFKSCRLHDMVRDLCLSKAKEEDFFDIIDFQNENNTEHVGSSSSFTSKARRVVNYSHEENNSNNDVFVDKITSQHLRSLLFFNESREHKGRMPRMVKSRLNDFKLLRVLAIEGFDPFEIPKAIGKLIHLRYLCLRDNSLGMFPSYIKNLKHLQTLDLRVRNSVSFQCKGNLLGKMRQLRHLYLPREMVRSFQASKLRLDGLINLEILENFDPSWCESEDLIKLINLRKLTARVKLQNLKGAKEIISYLSTNLSNIRYSSLWFEDCNFASEEWPTILIQLLESGRQIDSCGSIIKEDQKDCAAIGTSWCKLMVQLGRSYKITVAFLSVRRSTKVVVVPPGTIIDGNDK